MDIKGNILLCESTDASNNNIFHMCAKTGNESMLNMLFNLIPAKIVLPLLEDTNNVIK